MVPRRGKRSRLEWVLPVGIGAGALGLSVAIGFAGAPHRESFDWALAGVVGTALGTIMLAVYTAWLARTTREEVNVAIEEQRARDRPMVVVVKKEIGAAGLDITIGLSTPVLTLDIANVGSGPAFDVRLRARWSRPSSIEPVAVIPVIGVGETIEDYLLSLSVLDFLDSLADERPLAVEDFTIEGSYADRADERHAIRVLVAAGLRDEQRAAERQAAVRAFLTLTFESLPPKPRGDNLVYDLQLDNLGLGTASNVKVECFQPNGQPFGEPLVRLDTLQPHHPERVEVPLPRWHPTLSCRISWDDGIAEGRHADMNAFFPAPTASSPSGV